MALTKASNQVIQPPYLTSNLDFPSSATNGDMLLYTPTGRKFLLQYIAGTWNPISSFGSTVLYVDAANGTDSIDKGFGTGTNAYKTIQYAVDALPAMLNGGVSIYVSAGTYRELVTIKGVNISGNFSINFFGELTTLFSGTATAGNATTITTTSTSPSLNAWAGKLLKITSGTGSGQNRIILSNTNGANSVVTVEKFLTNPDNGSVYEIDDWATRVTGSNAGADTTPVRTNAVNIMQGASPINFYWMKFNYATGSCVVYSQQCVGTLTGCYSHNGTSNFISTICSNVSLISCYAGVGTTPAGCSQQSVMSMSDCLVKGSTGNGLGCNYGSYTGITRCTFDTNGAAGIVAQYGSTVNFAGTSSTLISTIKNNTTWGCQASTGSTIALASGQTYSGNGSGTYTPTSSIAGGTT